MTKFGPFRSAKLDLGCYANIRTIRDHTKRKVYEIFEPERQALRYIVRNTSLPQDMRSRAQLELAQMHCYTQKTQVKNRCIMAGKGRGILADFRMSRVGRCELVDGGKGKDAAEGSCVY